MKRFSEQLHKKSETVRLLAAEKRALRDRVVSYMEYHPLPAEAKAKRIFADTAALTEEYRVIRIPFTIIARVVASMAVVVFVVVPVLAERAVPGDGLYAVKVRFNEEVRSTLAFSTSQKVAWETERLNRRIAEARLLASEGKLSGDAEATVAAAVRSHTDEVQRNIALLRTVDADEATLASIALETTLEVQSASLRKPATSGDEVMLMAMAARSDESSASAPVQDLFSQALEESRAKASASNVLSVAPAFERTMARIELNTTRLHELMSSLTPIVTPEQRGEVQRRTSDIERAIAEALLLRQTDEMAARQELVAILQRTQRLVVYMTDLAVANAVDIEEIVPVVLTETEKQQEIKRYRAETNALTEQVRNALAGEQNADLAEKTKATLDVLIQHNAVIASSTDHSVVKAEAFAARVIATDMLSMLSLTPAFPTLPVAETSTTTSTSTESVASSTVATSSTAVVDSQ